MRGSERKEGGSNHVKCVSLQYRRKEKEERGRRENKRLERK